MPDSQCDSSADTNGDKFTRTELITNTGREESFSKQMAIDCDKSVCQARPLLGDSPALEDSSDCEAHSSIMSNKHLSTCEDTPSTESEFQSALDGMFSC